MPRSYHEPDLPVTTPSDEARTAAMESAALCALRHPLSRFHFGGGE